MDEKFRRFAIYVVIAMVMIMIGLIGGYYLRQLYNFIF